MYRGAAVGVVVPAYNEEGLVGGVLEEIPPFVDRAYVVDDASTDGTWTEILRHASDINERTGPWTDGGLRYTSSDADIGGSERVGADAGSDETTSDGPRVVPIRHDENRGVGGAIKTGYRHALSDGMDAIASLGGDGQMDTDYLPNLLDPVVEDRVGFAKGTRVSSPEHRSGIPRWRLFGTYLLTGLTRVATGYWGITDSQNGYTVVSREALSEIALEELYDGYGFVNDLLARFSLAGIKIADVPHPPVYGDEESSIRYRTFVPRLSGLLFVRFLERIRSSVSDPVFVPASLGYVFGSVAVVLGFVQLFAVIVGAATPVSPRDSGLMAGLLGGGALLLATAVFADIGASMATERHRRVITAEGEVR